MIHFDTRDLDSARDSGSPAIRIKVAEDSAPDHIVIPDAQFLVSAKFKKAGSDLTLTGPDGQTIIVEGYFDLLKRPDLMAPGGGGLSADVVERLAVSETAGQYAQVGAPAGAVVIGRVERLGGSATVQHANGTTQELQIGDAVYQGDVIETRDDSLLGVSFNDGTAFNMGTNARMVLSELVYSASSQSNSGVFNLIKGTMTFVAGQAAKSGDMRVVTPVSTMGIRGTTAQVTVSTDAFGNTLSVVYSLMSDPDGHIGAFDILDSSGNVIGTVRTTDSTYHITPSANLSLLSQQLQKTPEIIQAELAVAQILFPIFLANPANFMQTPDLQPKGPGTIGSSQALTAPPQGFDDPGPTKIITVTVSGTSSSSPPGSPPGTPPQDVVTFPEQPVPVVIPSNLLPLINVDISANLVEAASGNPGAETSSAPVIKGDLDGPVNYDIAALIADNWRDLENGIFGKLGSYGAATLNTTGVTAAALLAAGWVDVGSGIYEKIVILLDANGNPFSETVRVNSSANTLTYMLDNAKADPLPGGAVATDQFIVRVIDENGAKNQSVATFTIEGTNDAAVLSTDVRHLAEANSAGAISASGVLTVTDIDNAPTFQTQTGTVGLYGKFSIAADGAWHYTATGEHNEFAEGVTYTDTFQVFSADGTATTVTINILGTDDEAVLSSDVRNLIEANSAHDISTFGKLTIVDPDSPQTFVAQTDTAGLYGKFSIGADGCWTYKANGAHNEFVDGTTYTDTFHVLSADGTQTSVTINILGTEDGPVGHNDQYDALLGKTLHICAHEGVLDNDTDANGDDLQASLIGDNIDGHLTFNSDGSFDFRPYFLGTTSFSYVPNDGANSGAPTLVTIDVSAGADTIDNSASTVGATISAPSYIKNIVGGSGNDILLANVNDSLLNGGGGNDRLFGGKGDDVLIGGEGNDRLTGGAGSDIFVFRGAFGHDTVADFNVGDSWHHDVLDLRGFGFQSILDVLDHTDLGSSAVIHVGTEDITLTSVTKAMLAANSAAILI